jgi:cytochrome c oxidase cbb3-type subunit 2
MSDYLRTYQLLGVPYTNEDIDLLEQDIKVQLGMITEAKMLERFKERYPNTPVRKFHIRAEEITEIDALIAYLQGLGNKINPSTTQGRQW